MCKGSSDQLNMFRVHIANISDPALLHTCAPLTMRTESDFNMVCYSGHVTCYEDEWKVNPYGLKHDGKGYCHFGSQSRCTNMQLLILLACLLPNRAAGSTKCHVVQTRADYVCIQKCNMHQGRTLSGVGSAACVCTLNNLNPDHSHMFLLRALSSGRRGNVQLCECDFAPDRSIKHQGRTLSSAGSAAHVCTLNHFNPSHFHMFLLCASSSGCRGNVQQCACEFAPDRLIKHQGRTHSGAGSAAHVCTLNHFNPSHFHMFLLCVSSSGRRGNVQQCACEFAPDRSIKHQGRTRSGAGSTAHVRTLNHLNPRHFHILLLCVLSFGCRGGVQLCTYDFTCQGPGPFREEISGVSEMCVKHSQQHYYHSGKMHTQRYK